MTKIENQTVCVTGAAGFLGSKLCRELAYRGSNVIAIDNFAVGERGCLSGIENKIEIIKADIRDKDSIKEYINNKWLCS